MDRNFAVSAMHLGAQLDQGAAEKSIPKFIPILRKRTTEMIDMSARRDSSRGGSA